MKSIKKITVLGLLGVALALTGCSPVSDSASSSEKSVASSSSSSSAADVEVITNEDLGKGATEYKDAEGKTQKLTRSQLYANAGSPHVNSYPTTGKKQKLLVAPIKFTKDETDANDTIVADDALLEKIKVTFTGTSEEMAAVGGTISVKEFYERSSFGKGAFDVVMIPTWIDFGETAKSYESSSGGQAGVSAAERVRTWYINEYAKDGHGSLGSDAYSLDDLDSDDDGYIDLIWNVYAYPYSTTNTNFWWAYVTYTGNGKGTLERPAVQTLAWASTNFLSEGSNGYESRTFIHETGHTLGMDDYYDYNKEWSPAGGIDYMDQNVGDHNSYSKFAYGWVNPWVLRESDLEKDKKEAEITLRLATTSGDCLVLASPNYNNTAFDEYMMVELVGPGGLCEKDYKNKSGFTEYGIRVWHIDARAKSNKSIAEEEVFSTPDEVGQKATDVRNDNSKFGRSKDGDFWTTDNGVKRSYSQISILESSWDDVNAQTSASYVASNASLYTKNATFTLKGSSGEGRATMYMPSQSNLWNKAKKITSGGVTSQKYEIDSTMTCNYSFRVKSIKDDATYGKVATIRVKLV